jgi:putative SOS response-associated peptidase YedK
MCGRYTMVEPGLVPGRFGVDGPFDEKPRFNIAPTQDVIVVRPRRSGDGRELRQMRWGLVPSFAHDASGGARMITARAETVGERPAFRQLVERRRCVVPADGFYEWRRGPDGRRQPLRFTVDDGQPFALAGLWDRWRDPATGEPLDSCTILTCAPNSLVAPVHDRMPVILTREAEDLWLDPAVPADQALAALVPFPAERMAVAEASTRVNTADYEAPDCLDPAAGAGGEQLTLV